MTTEEYLNQRLDQQIAWYDKKSELNQVRFRSLKLFIIVLSVFIPFLAGLINDQREWLKVAVGIGGVAIALFEGVLTLYKYQENWLEYRYTAEALRREKILFLAKAGPYLNNQQLHYLVERVEGIMSNENQDWVKTQSSIKEEDQN
ncbi:MAG: DUF4231 domain-containing protein [Bacteroidota bacterium]